MRLPALQADHIPVEVSTLPALDEWLDLPVSLVEALRQLSASRPIVLLKDQIAELMDLRSSRLAVVLSLIRKLRGAEGIHIVLSLSSLSGTRDRVVVVASPSNRGIEIKHAGEPENRRNVRVTCCALFRRD